MFIDIMFIGIMFIDIMFIGIMHRIHLKVILECCSIYNKPP